MLYIAFPYNEGQMNNNAYKGLCCCYGMMRIFAGISMIESKDIIKMIDALSCLFHYIDHTDFYNNVCNLSDNVTSLLKL